ncbi:hypothetical protein F5Y11DRAFT_330020 [Daldinia sp. FL1419]|nr:hypothetical protein F5Y11DRAFT_330020 [Daldinia sp. FL1419]
MHWCVLCTYMQVPTYIATCHILPHTISYYLVRQPRLGRRQVKVCLFFFSYCTTCLLLLSAIPASTIRATYTVRILATI